VGREAVAATKGAVGREAVAAAEGAVSREAVAATEGAVGREAVATTPSMPKISVPGRAAPQRTHTTSKRLSPSFSKIHSI
jgi:hypothetical protein